MSFFFGRRRSQSDETSTDHVDSSTGRPSLSHRHIRRRSLDLNRVESTNQATLRGNVRRQSDSLLSVDRGAGKHGDGNPPDLTSKQESIGSSRCGTRTTHVASSHDPLAGADQTEPKQPGNIQELLKYRLDLAASSTRPSNGSALTKNDIKAMLSGAPHFLLERGKHGRWYPQVIFPWDEHNPFIQRLWDRKPLPHTTFTLCTLHAHLPVPDALLVGDDRRGTGAAKRATFDVGIFEVPNMLSNNGQEHGSIGFRYFLELPIADLVQFVGPAKTMPSLNLRRISTLPATEAFELMEHYSNPYSQCQNGGVHNRHRLICDGPAAWKHVGVRDINLRSLVQRLDHLRRFRQDMFRNGSIEMDCDELHNILHTHFLYPPPRAIVGHDRSLKSQIKTLTIVLATPGAWIDFSLPEWRFRIGQVLWEAPPHEDGDCLDPNACSEGFRDKSGLERKWLLIQMLLAAELLLRLDGTMHNLHGSQITVQELHEFNKLRNGKVNWDLLVVCRFLDSLDIKAPRSTSESSQSTSPIDHPAGKPRRSSLFEAITHRRPSASQGDLRSAWECQVSSSHVRQQLEGLYVFGENIGWPRMHALKANMESMLGEDLALPELNFQAEAQAEAGATPLGKDDMYTRNPSRRLVRLSDRSPGWISRSWLSGLVIPGEGISHLLMATLLENDPDALKYLGSTANLYGGFVYRGRSWWSKECIVGRVLSSSEGAKTCMGWVSSEVLPRDVATLESVKYTWFEVPVQELESKKPRIKQGGRLAMESTPLGIGDITADAFTLPTDRPASEIVSTVSMGALTCESEASVSFLTQGSPTTFPLRYNVRFISSHECRPPLGFLWQNDQRQNVRNRHKRLPGHPLHRSFAYKHVLLLSLPTRGSDTLPTQEVWVIDARGSRANETFARAWCASVGCHAIIGRCGRTCVACCVREARAVDVQVVIRVSD